MVEVVGGCSFVANEEREEGRQSDVVQGFF